MPPLRPGGRRHLTLRLGSVEVYFRERGMGMNGSENVLDRGFATHPRRGFVYQF